MYLYCICWKFCYVYYISTPTLNFDPRASPLSDIDNRHLDINTGIRHRNSKMGYFIVDLWESIFTPGTTPTLVKATHGSFVLLILSLLFLIWNALNIHTVLLLIIALCLWGTLTWFIAEVAKLKAEGKLKTDKELREEAEKQDAKKED